MIALWVILSITVIVCDIIAAIKFGEIVELKGHTDLKVLVLVLCILLPLAGYCMAIALPDMPLRWSLNTLTTTPSCKVNDTNLPEL